MFVCVLMSWYKMTYDMKSFFIIIFLIPLLFTLLFVAQVPTGTGLNEAISGTRPKFEDELKTKDLNQGMYLSNYEGQFVYHGVVFNHLWCLLTGFFHRLTINVWRGGNDVTWIVSATCHNKDDKKSYQQDHAKYWSHPPGKPTFDIGRVA